MPKPGQWAALVVKSDGQEAGVQMYHNAQREFGINSVSAPMHPVAPDTPGTFMINPDPPDIEKLQVFAWEHSEKYPELQIVMIAIPDTGSEPFFQVY